MVDMSGMGALALGLLCIWPIFCLWFHEFGHFLATKVLGYKPIALITLGGILPWAVARESIRNNRDEMIVATAGPSAGFFASVALAFAAVASGAWSSTLVWLPALAVPLSSSIGDFKHLWIISRYSGEERERRSIRSVIRTAPPSRLCVAIIFSNDMWPIWKKIQERRLGKKLDFKEVYLRRRL